MALRCLLFSSEEGTAEPIRQVLVSLGVEGEYCTEANTALKEVAQQNFQIVIIDWDDQPQAGLLLTAARQRKAAERALTLAIVSDDASAPEALQAGANSILRKPLLINQIKDTLATARDLLRAKQDSAAAVAAGASANSGSTQPGSASVHEPPVRGTEILEAARGTFGTKSHAPEFVTAFEVTAKAPAPPPEIRPAAPIPVEEDKSVSEPVDGEEGPRGLQWYLKTKVKGVAAAPNPAPVKSSPAPGRPDLLGYDQMAAPSVSTVQKAPAPPASIAPEPKPRSTQQERAAEAELFAYMTGESPASEKAPKSGLGKRGIIIALVLAGCAILAAPQAPWHSAARDTWIRGRKAMHSWLNPQPVTPVQAPAGHESFSRAGDEYKLPPVEPIPDATTDPSQIQVVPVVDPTEKKPPDPSALVQPPPLPAGTTLVQTDPTPSSGAPVTNQPQSSTNPPREPFAAPSTGTAAAPPVVSRPATSHPGPTIPQSLTSPPSLTTAFPTPIQTVQSKNPAPYANTPSNVPSSLKSQLASLTPDAGGNKAPEAALPSIEPVVVTEAAERALATEQPAVAYPSNAKGQHGSVVLQVLIGRDGTVQEAKFMQGSFAFARAAIDGVKQWKFKPYLMNGRPVSVQTQLTLSFKPGQ